MTAAGYICKWRWSQARSSGRTAPVIPLTNGSEAHALPYPAPPPSHFRPGHCRVCLMHNTGATVARIARADAATWGRAMEATARSTAAVLVAVFTVGLVVGAWVHRLSEALAVITSSRTRTTAPQKATQAEAARSSHRHAMSIKTVQAPSERRSDLLRALAA